MPMFKVELADLTDDEQPFSIRPINLIGIQSCNLFSFQKRSSLLRAGLSPGKLANSTRCMIGTQTAAQSR